MCGNSVCKNYTPDFQDSYDVTITKLECQLIGSGGTVVESANAFLGIVPGTSTRTSPCTSCAAVLVLGASRIDFFTARDLNKKVRFVHVFRDA